MADIVSFNQTNGEPTVSVAVGNDSDPTVVVVGKDSASPKPKQPGVMAIVRRNVDNIIQTVCEPARECLSGCGLFIIVLCLVGAICLMTNGSYHLHECPIEPFIPIWVVVFWGVIAVEMIWQICCKINSALDKLDVYGILILQTFKLAWLIAGSVWVYSVWHKVSCNPTDTANYCRERTFRSAMAVITLLWSLLALVMLGFIVCFIYTRVTAAVASNNPAPINTPPHLVKTQLPSISL